MKSVTSVLVLFALTVASAFAVQSDRITSPMTGRSVAIQSHVPFQAQPKYDQGAVEPTFKLNHMILQTPPSAAQRAAITKLIADQQNPRSASYHRWLTPEQYAERFGLSTADVTKLTQWLKGQGFKVNSVARGRTFIVFSGTAAQVKSAFGTEIHRYNVNGEAHFANATNPMIPAGLSGIVTGIRGLNSFGMKPAYNAANFKKNAQRKNGRWFGNYYDSGFNSQFLAPGDITTIYDIDTLYPPATAGTGQSIAVIGQTDVYAADLSDFRSGFGLPAIAGCTANGSGILAACTGTNFSVIYADGPTAAPGVSPGDLSESDLDLEWSNAVAPQANIIFVTSPSFPAGNGVVDSFYYAIDNDVAPIISMSYGICELGEGANFTADDAELASGSTEGITFLSSTGDQGAAGCDTNNTDPNSLAQLGLAVQFPAASANVTGVGGTGVPSADLGPAFWGTTNGATGGSALGAVPQQGWNDDAEIGLFCVNNPTNSFCVSNGITNQQTAQAAIGLSGGGGGPSNCTTQNGSGVCTAGTARPTWQNGLVITVPAGQIGATKTRLVPDLSGLASPNFPGYIVCVPQSELSGSSTSSTCTAGIQDAIETYQSLIGGTSASTPVTAGIVALLNQYLGATGLGNINPQLYAIAPQVGPIVQITTGDNTMYCSPATPVGQPAALQCPVSGVFGFTTTDFDTNTGYNMATGLGVLDVDLFAVAWSASRSATTTGLVPSASSVYQGQPITLTATVAPATATGSVSFLSGTTIVGTQAVGAGGVAVLTNPVLPIGTDSVTAQYNGDGYNMPSTSTPVSTITVVAAFTLAAPATSVTQGQTASGIVVTMTPAAGFTTALTYSCSLPAPETTCTVSPTTPTTSNPTLTITTTAPSAMFHAKDQRVSRIFYALLLPGLFGLVLVGKSNRKGRVLMMLGFVAVLASSTLWMSACSSSSSSHDPGTPKNNYTVTVNATTGGSNPITGSTTFTLTVQ
jgi:subtilase family serine protease